MVALTIRSIGRRAESASPSPEAAAAAAAAAGEAMATCQRGLIEQSLAARYSDWIAEALDEIQACFLITDPGIAGHPIVFASRGFLAMSGYSREEVLGRNGRIFQGPATDRRSVMEIREAIREERMLQISLLNYRKDGAPHWILFRLCPVFGVEDGRVAHFVAVQVPIPKRSRCSRSSAEARHGGASGRLFGACRNELRSDYDLGCHHAADLFIDADNRGLEAEESREASEQEKERASDATNSILSTLAHYSKLTGKVVSGKRCSVAGISPFSSSLTISLGRIKQSFVLTDPHLPDMPIVYASDEFLGLTGYSKHEVLGRNCGFLNGPDTDVEVLHQIRQSIQGEHACTVRLLNYRKDGSSFWNLLHMSPVRNASGKIAFYVNVQSDENAKSDGLGLSPEMRQLGVVGAVKVAVRSLSICAGPSRPSS
uniref:Putative LOV domain-containing protein n=1 Tax=Heliconia sp. BC-2016 TaxID=1799582 RepID=A0A126X3L3_9LILI|nr:putative LOV domain-containing protein [Heliconia sp. BC-2016]